MGVFLTIEGGEFTGKTSLIVPTLRDVLGAAGVKVKVSREPGGTPGGEEIRQRIFSRLREGAGQGELAVLFNEARRIHLQDVIWPFLGREREKEGVFILDRYLDSTRVYQGLEGGVPLETLAGYEREYVSSFYPDLTLIAFFPPEVFGETFKIRSRFSSENGQGRSRTAWDESKLEVHRRRQEYYLSLPETYRQMGIERKFALLDASRHPFEVIRESVELVGGFLGREQDLLREYRTLLEGGAWREFDEIWSRQQEGYRTFREGVPLRGKER